jgi:hypothetical protein
LSSSLAAESLLFGDAGLPVLVQFLENLGPEPEFAAVRLDLREIGRRARVADRDVWLVLGMVPGSQAVL